MITDVSTCEMTVDGSEYILTLGTGETSYGRDGGTLAFAYPADEFRAARATTYLDLCDEMSPVGDSAELLRIAIAAAARHEYRVAIAGACKAVLSDGDYALIRAAVEAVRG